MIQTLQTKKKAGDNKLKQNIEKERRLEIILRLHFHCSLTELFGLFYRWQRWNSLGNMILANLG